MFARAIHPSSLCPYPYSNTVFIEIKPIPFFQQVSSALLSGESLSSQGLYWSMIASTIPASAAAIAADSPAGPAPMMAICMVSPDS